MIILLSRYFSTFPPPFSVWYGRFEFRHSSAKKSSCLDAQDFLGPGLLTFRFRIWSLDHVSFAANRSRSFLNWKWRRRHCGGKSRRHPTQPFPPLTPLVRWFSVTRKRYLYLGCKYVDLGNSPLKIIARQSINKIYELIFLTSGWMYAVFRSYSCNSNRFVNWFEQCVVLLPISN